MVGSKEEKLRFAVALQKVALVTPKKEKPDAPTLRLYYEALNDFTIDTIEDVAEELIRTEEQMFAIPPPGRWRAVALTFYELKSERALYEAPRAIRCEFCQDTGWRPVRKGYEKYVRWCECKTGGVPIDESQGGYVNDRPLAPLDGELPAPDLETELARRRREHGNRIVTCACCSTPYRIRQGWKCCAPPVGTPSHVWFERWHDDCPNPAPAAPALPGRRTRRCPLHCQCAGRERPTGQFPMPKAGEHVHEWAVRLGFRDANAPGPDDQPTGGLNGDPNE